MAVLQEYKCPCCGGAIGFDSKAQKMKCPYCDTEFELDSLEAYDQELRNEQPDDMNWEKEGGTEWEQEERSGLRSYLCQSCGGELVTDENTAASACPYCGNPVVMTEQVSGSLKPDLVIPFKLDKKAAKEALRRHYKGKRLLPKVFADENHIDEIKGIYVPFWLFNADAAAQIRYRATRVRCWSDSQYNYTQTSYFAVTRAGSLGFSNVPVDGSSKIADELMESIEPFDLSEAVDFRTAYLAGYFADKYDVTAEQSKERANERIRVSTEDAFAATVHGYSSVIREASSVRLENSAVKYALLPVWLLNTTWNGQQYTFAMNGQTGKMVGNLPVDNRAYFRWLLGLTGVIGAVSFVVSWLAWLL